MKRVSLASTGRTTTQLGFGCAFPPSVSGQQAARYLDAAYDAGIRHFDVAPSYSDGAAEGYLGNFLKRRAGDTTVTTKYGILPSAERPFHIRMARTILGPVVRSLRRLPIAASGLAKSSAAMNLSKAAFSAPQARQSLDSSLQKLGLDRVDLFLMHEPSVADLADPGLLQFLTDSVAANRIGGFGVGGGSTRISDLHRSRRPYCDVMQFDWTAFSPDYELDTTFRIHYWVFSRKLGLLHRDFLARPDLRRRWSDQVGLDVGDLKLLAAVMLKAALLRYPDSIVLFTSSNPENMTRNIRVAEDSALDEKALRFCELARKEGDSSALSARS